jgi:ribosomal protein S18 acetylase RimI-like enzyme
VRLEIQQLTRERAVEHGHRLLAFSKDNDWEYWTMENLLAERPDKWRFSSLAVRGGEPVGYAIVSRTGEGGHLHHFAVTPDLRGQGIGRQLLARTAQVLRDAGLGRLTLKVYRSNAGALRMYRALGFAVTEDPAAELLRMSLELPANEGQAT